ncbi:MAG: 16S rRNA (uracil(1498)-N(3))-methyltransferase [Phycisphaerales bacterium]|nr:16S rRNA (uracil(1498)-N(3))-methyltransferase [Phycisphaerales bacterium]
MHRVFLRDAGPDADRVLTIVGEEARHALRVKRLGPGDALELLDGEGAVHSACVEAFDKQGRGEWIMRVRIERTERRPPISPGVHAVVAAPKGPHLDEMISQLSQVGAASWSPLRSERSVSEPGEKRLDRLRRIAEESSKQCGRAWAMRIGTLTTFDDALAPAPAIVVADPEAEVYRPTRSPEIRLLVGPEGGWSKRELERALEAGAQVARFGPHAMRLETAAVVATAVILELERNHPEARSALPGDL